MSMEIKGSVVVISGGASGLGEACSRLFLENGASVCILDLQEQRGEILASELGEKAMFCRTDVTDPQGVQTAIERTVDKFGAVHVAISCAGVPHAAKVLSKKGPIPMDLFNRVVQVNLMGTMHVIRSAAEQMVKNAPNADGERGVVINTSSGAAYEGQIGQAAYSASKAGIIGMTLPIAREFADYGLRCVTIAPGMFDTPMFGELPPVVKQGIVDMAVFPKRMGRPLEFAKMALHIVENPMLNGRTIRLDGAVPKR
jgi:3-hydroxyacyl-CoA dehydrogenase / 3-hydroxy-2-methylbutyryl-CoA dehydrogenase